MAATHAAEVQAKKHWEDLEREKNRLESEFRREEEAQEEDLRRERQRIEAEETAKYVPKIEALKEKHQQLQAEEAALRSSLQAAGASKDLVTTAISCAVSEILKRLRDLFQSSEGGASRAAGSPSLEGATLEMQEWEQSVRTMVRNEIRTAFVSSVSSAAESERSEFSKSFEEMLRFWSEAEEEERHHVTKMDEQLMMDLQAIAHEDLDRLQREEQKIEELFMQSREQWTLHHQDMLHRELEAVLSRRTKELEAQRTLRNELHQRRLREVEEAHKEKMENFKLMHEKKLDLIRSEQQMLERVHTAKFDMLKQVRENASTAMGDVHKSVDSLSVVLSRMKDLQRSLDDMRGGLDRDRQRSLELREQTLSDVQGLIVAQATAVEQERSALGTAMLKLEVTQASVDRQLEQERLWIAETQAKLERSKGDWEREYRRWQQAVASEKRRAEEKFSDVLLKLGEAASQLEEESRDIELEGNNMRRACSARSTAVAAELADVTKKQDELNEKHQALILVLADLEAKSRDLSSQWQETLSERQGLASQRAELEREEMKLQKMTEQLEFMKHHVEHTQYETREAASRGRGMAAQLDVSRDALRDGLDRVRRHAQSAMTEQQALRERENHSQRKQTAVPRPVVSSNANRLPLQVLAELRASLGEQYPHHMHSFGQQQQQQQQRASSYYRDPQQSVIEDNRHRQESHHEVHQPPTAASSHSRQSYSSPTSERIAAEQPQRSAPTQDDGDELTQTAGAASSYHFTNLLGISDAETTSASAMSQPTS
ncbi:Hypothetical protein, putative [Bodo saltans]|uniref:Uncharacterized protein n=1 Tax=Bodo saltans TaxID=75058 RepID=A0A0S4IKJ1_BODSA|nr:Hypothetical protein, putative [Bodo saltans]|eukprot:CUE67018.1 Hypothetical protein, putative [Bodo saltans]